ncbi:hypothetical protein LEP3755_30490 [Leptolyngbya sp. NIES-3755]|nr:hypothetical protein LEP3755_30490 [Leptolyngbya sp. NIES-3755]
MKPSNIIAGILIGLAILQLIPILPDAIYVIRTAIEHEQKEGQH